MSNSEQKPRYLSLTIEAESNSTSIWLADCRGHLVQKADGRLETSVLAGEYVVQFTLGGTTYPISLLEPLKLAESEIKSGPSCPRPEVRFVDDLSFPAR